MDRHVGAKDCKSEKNKVREVRSLRDLSGGDQPRLQHLSLKMFVRMQNDPQPVETQ